MAVSVCVVLISVLGSVLSYSTGPPSTACASMTPSHGGSPQTGPAPFSLSASQSTYMPGDVITVTLSGTRNFKGFFMQARDSDEVHIGNFNAPARTRTMFCGEGLAVSHSQHLQGTNTLSVQYTAPEKYFGVVQFVVTVVENYSTYHVKVLGPSLTATSAQMTNACNLPENSMSLVELSARSLSVSWKKVSACATSCQVEFTVRAAIGTGLGNKYVAIGFSKDSLMGDDSVVDCIETGFGTVGVQASFNAADGKMNDVLTNPNEGLEFISGSRTDGVLECVFKRYVNTADSKVFDLAAQKYRLLVALGDVSSNVKSIHSLQAARRPVISTEMVDFFAPGMYRTLL